MARREPVVIGVAEHAGWAHLVTVALTTGQPAVVDRRRVALIDEGVPTQPYHHEALTMALGDAERLVRTVRKSIAARTAQAFEGLSRDVAPRRVVAIAIRQGTLERLPATVEEAHASYHVQCRADGMLYFTAVCEAARALGWDIECFMRGQEIGAAAEALGTGVAKAERLIDDLKRTLGPPWTADHRFACAAAVAALAARSATK